MINRETPNEENIIEARKQVESILDGAKGLKLPKEPTWKALEKLRIINSWAKDNTALKEYLISSNLAIYMSFNLEDWLKLCGPFTKNSSTIGLLFNRDGLSTCYPDLNERNRMPIDRDLLIENWSHNDNKLINRVGNLNLVNSARKILAEIK